MIIQTPISLIKGRVVCKTASGIEYAQPMSSNQTLGFVTLSVPANYFVEIREKGVLDGFSGLTPGLPIYLGGNGAITQTPPATSTIQAVGVAISTTEVLVQIHQKIQQVATSEVDFAYWAQWDNAFHEAAPIGVPSYYDWYTKARLGFGATVPVDANNILFTHLMNWGQVFTKSGESVHSSQISLRNFKVYACHGTNKLWSLLNTGELTGAQYDSDFQSNVATPVTITNNDGVYSTSFAVGEAFHFYGTQRAAIPSDLKSIAIFVDAKNTTPINTSIYLLGLGLDYWRTESALWAADWSNNKDAGIGRLGLVSDDWRTFGMIVDTENNINTLTL